MKTLKDMLGGLKSPPRFKEDAHTAPVSCEPQHFNPDKFGHIVVQNKQEMYEIPCKMRQPGMTVTVVNEDYTEFILKATEGTKCNNDLWQVPESGGLWKYVPSLVEENNLSLEDYAMYFLGSVEFGALFYKGKILELLDYPDVVEGLMKYRFKDPSIEEYPEGRYIDYTTYNSDRGFIEMPYYPTAVRDMLHVFIVQYTAYITSKAFPMPMLYLDQLKTAYTLEETCEQAFKLIATAYSLVPYENLDISYLDRFKALNFHSADSIEEERRILLANGYPDNLKDFRDIFREYYEDKDTSFAVRFILAVYLIANRKLHKTDSPTLAQEVSVLLSASSISEILNIFKMYMEEGILEESTDLSREDIEKIKGQLVDKYPFLADPNANLVEAAKSISEEDRLLIHLMTYHFMANKHLLIGLRGFLEEDTIPPSFKPVKEILIPTDIYRESTVTKDYIENLQGTSARLKEGYNISHGRDLITKEYYENNLPEQEPPELTGDIVADLTVGGINEEAVLPEGMTFQEFAETLLTKIYYPTFTNPSFSLSNNAGSREVGESINVTYTRSFSRGQITLKGKVVGDYTGPVSNVTIDGTVTAAASIIIPKVVTLGSNTVSGSALFAAGPDLYDSKGNFYSVGYRGGTLTATTSFTGYYKRFYGPTDGTTPARSLPSNALDNAPTTFNLVTGTTHRMFDLYIPSTRSLSEVLDLDALNANITANYILQGTVQVADAGGTMVNYKHYRMTNDMPYGESHRHQIKL